MSWQSLVDETLIGNGQVFRAAIHGLNGTCFATSSGFLVQPTEVIHIVKGLTKDSSILYKGIQIEKKNYQFMGCEPGLSVLCSSKTGGLIIMKSNQCVLIAEYNDTAQAGLCYARLEKLVNHLKAYQF